MGSLLTTATDQKTNQDPDPGGNRHCFQRVLADGILHALLELHHLVASLLVPALELVRGRFFGNGAELANIVFHARGGLAELIRTRTGICSSFHMLHLLSTVVGLIFSVVFTARQTRPRDLRCQIAAAKYFTFLAAPARATLRHAMHPKTVLETIRAELAPGAQARLLAYGSSNTERFLPGMHWLDVLEIALRDTYGRFHQCLNAGLCGDTSRGLLTRFAEEAAIFRPHLAIVTIGGNDSNPATGIPPDQFAANLRELHQRFTALGTRVIFQTYYAPNPAPQDDLTGFRHYMDLVRLVARDTRAPLVDHLPRWEAYQQTHRDRYLQLMRDSFHVNAVGNLVLGLDLARQFGARPVPDEPGFWTAAQAIQQTMDALRPGRASS